MTDCLAGTASWLQVLPYERQSKIHRQLWRIYAVGSLGTNAAFATTAAVVGASEKKKEAKVSVGPVVQAETTKMCLWDLRFLVLVASVD